MTFGSTSAGIAQARVSLSSPEVVRSYARRATAAAPTRNLMGTDPIRNRLAKAHRLSHVTERAPILAGYGWLCRNSFVLGL